jgi:hypothetical protein
MSIHDALSAQQFNDEFLTKVASLEGQAQLSEAGRQYVKTELQETAFSRAIIPQEPVTAADCQRNVNDNSLYLIRDVEPGVSALGVDNLGEPDGNYIRGERYTIPIVNFVTKRFQITVEDLKAYQYKITKRIEDKSVPILEKLEDKLFLRMAGAAALATGGKSILTGGEFGTGTGNPGITTFDHVELKNKLQSGGAKKLEVANMLMTQEMYETIIEVPTAADDFGTSRVIDGISSDTAFGTKVIRTIKSDLIPTGHTFAFTKPDFLGHNFALGEPTFEIKSQFGLIEWQTKESVGMGLGNTEAVALAVNSNTADMADGTAVGTIAEAKAYYASLRV